MTAATARLAGSRSVSAVATYAAVVAVSAAAGIALAAAPLRTLAAVAIAVAVIVGVVSWRASLVGLLLYMPFAGIATVLTYPETEYAILAKDVLFVVPAYLGFCLYLIRRQASFFVPGLPMGLIALFAGLVIAQMANPSVPSLVVALIGAKVWLCYVPLAALGYFLVRDEREVIRFLTVIAVVAVVPACVGIVEGLAIMSGSAERVYELYGPAAGAVTQNFAEFQYEGGATLRRVPSTFSFVTQYYVYLSVMVALTYALWRMADTGRARTLAGMLWLVMLVAAFLSGARGAFVLIPVLVCVIVALDRGLARHTAVWLAPLAALGGVASMLGSSGSELLTRAIETGRGEFVFTFVGGVREAISAGWLGLGTGTFTNAARHAYNDTTSFVSTHGVLNESWYVKSQLELGVAGLALLVAIVVSTLWVALQRHRRIRSPRLRAFSAAVIGLLVWNILYAFKAQYVDLDPLNVYFWLLLGILARVWAIDAEHQEGDSR